MKNITLENINFRLGEEDILRDINLTIESGNVLMLVGPNGAGKSTLLDLFIGMAKPSSGKILIDGNPNGFKNSIKMNIGYLPENIKFTEHLSAVQILSFFARAKKVQSHRIQEVLQFIGLQNAAKKATGLYSNGMKQRLGLGIAILSNPQILILDEPTSALDQEGMAVLFKILDKWRSKNRMVLLTTHDISTLESRVSHICILKEGAIQLFDTPENLKLSQGIPHHTRISLKENNKNFMDSLAALKSIKYRLLDKKIDIFSQQESFRSIVNLWQQHSESISEFSIHEPALNDVYKLVLERKS